MWCFTRLRCLVKYKRILTSYADYHTRNSAAGANSSRSKRNTPILDIKPKVLLTTALNKRLLKLPKCSFKPVRLNKQDRWLVQLSLEEPEQISFESTGQSKSEAENLAALQAYNYLEKLGILEETQDNTNNVSCEVRSLFSKPKETVLQTYEILQQQQKALNTLQHGSRQTTKMLKRNIQRVGQLWEANYSVQWPKPYSVSGRGRSKATAEDSACLQLLSWLSDMGRITSDGKIRYSSGSERAHIRKLLEKPFPVLLTETEASLTDAVINFQNVEHLISLNYAENEEPVFSENEESFRNIHPVTGKPWPPQIQGRIQMQNSILATKMGKRKQMLLLAAQSGSPPELSALATAKAALPISQCREKLLQIVHESPSRVSVITGETGSGKSTQLPQQILELWGEWGNAAECNIVISQPRRLTAVQLAERVAKERGEELGDRIGYQVRLRSRTPSSPGGAALFCTAGVLLRRLQTNPTLKGLSHVILDEAHQRDVDTDMLLALLKTAVAANPDLRLVIMSATIRSELFSKYFDNSPDFHVAGRTYPVKQYFLEDLEDFCSAFHYRKLHDLSKCDKHMAVNSECVANFLIKLDESRPRDGAILCFLPGWLDIKAVEKHLGYSDRRLIIPVHSQLSHEKQQEIFALTENDVRKIVLATNVAETGITVPDVSYVVDCGLHKENKFDVGHGWTSLGTDWISKANVLQRSGRAGRVRSGESYHLFSRERLQKMPPYPTPEILRTPLDKVILDVKTYNEKDKVEDLFERMLEPPESTVVTAALDSLQQLGAVDADERLTSLGRRISTFTCSPRLAKAMILSSFYRCVDPVVTLASILGEARDMFVLRHDIDENQPSKLSRPSKSKFNDSSDLLAMIGIFHRFVNIGGNHKSNRLFNEEVNLFCEELGLGRQTLNFISGVKGLYSFSMADAKLNADVESPDDNVHSTNTELVKAVLLASFGLRSVLRVQQGVISRGRIRSGVHLTDMNGKPFIFGSSSVLSKQKNLGTSPTGNDSLVLFYNGIYSEDRRATVVRDGTLVSPLALMLFGGNELQCSHCHGDQTRLILDSCSRFQFDVSNSVAEKIVILRDALHKGANYLITHDGFNSAPVSDVQEVRHYFDQLVAFVGKLLQAEVNGMSLTNESSSDSEESDTDFTYNAKLT